MPYLGGRANHGFHVYPNDMQMHVTTPPDHYLKKSLNICSDTLVHDPSALKLALDYFGEVKRALLPTNHLSIIIDNNN